MKKLIALIICITLSATLVGCGCSNSDDANLPDDKKVAVKVDGNEIFLDEAKYYAYSSQATYEVYYISNGEEIDWNEKLEEGTWEQVVKGKVLDDICRRECFYEKKDEYNVSLDDEAKEEIEKKVKNYYSQTSDNLKKKIGIKKKRLRQVFEKEYLSQKVEDIMNAEEKDSSGDYYKKWSEDVSVKCEKCWSDINFDDNVFTLQDAEIGITESK